MKASLLCLAAVAVLSVGTVDSCYQECSQAFNKKIQQLVGMSDQASLKLKSCEAMSEQMVCLENKKATCDSTSQQYVATILNFIRPDYQRTCAATMNSNATTVESPTHHALVACGTKASQCYSVFNATYGPPIPAMLQDVAIICAKMIKSLDNYTLCLEGLVPECGQFMSQAITYVKSLLQRYSASCSGSQDPALVTQCVNDTMDCYQDFNATFVPALHVYDLSAMCSSMDNYSTCLHAVHQKTDCQRYAHQALAGVFALKRQYAMFCSNDGGLAAGKCLQSYQTCYAAFNLTFFPALHGGQMDGVCSSVKLYADCVQPLYRECGQQMSSALQSVRVLKEQFALQCDAEFMRLSACKPLAVCLGSFAKSFTQGTAAPSSALCQTLASYFPCVKDGLAQCNIPPEDTTVDFSQLGSLTGAYCRNLLSNRVLNSCPEFVSCTSGIILVNTPDPSAMFDADTWCSYMDMSLSCVERAVNTRHCGLSNDDTIIGHLNQQRELKRQICKMSSVPPIDLHNYSVHGQAQGHGDSGAASSPAFASLTMSITIVSLASQLLL